MVYESFYIGRFNAFEYPHKYPHPLVCIGMLEGVSATRFSDADHRTGYKGFYQYGGTKYSNLRMFMNGSWLTPEAWPWINTYVTGDGRSQSDTHLRDIEGAYTLQPIQLTDTNGDYGVLDGIAHITGFKNVVTNTISVNNEEWVIFQDVWRTGASDYFAMRAN